MDLNIVFDYSLEQLFGVLLTFLYRFVGGCLETPVKGHFTSLVSLLYLLMSALFPRLDLVVLYDLIIAFK
ncbi:MAG: hypothetical protein ACK521_04020 [bacterium]